MRFFTPCRMTSKKIIIDSTDSYRDDSASSADSSAWGGEESHLSGHFPEQGNPKACILVCWIPASAGMTRVVFCDTCAQTL